MKRTELEHISARGTFLQNMQNIGKRLCYEHVSRNRLKYFRTGYPHLTPKIKSSVGLGRDLKIGGGFDNAVFHLRAVYWLLFKVVVVEV